jgi:hypothetical protein
MSTNPFDQPDTPSPAAAARDWVGRAVAAMVASADPDAFTERPLFPGAATIVRRPQPLPAARAALTLAGAAAAEARTRAVAARGEGASWAEVAAGLGFDELDTEALGHRPQPSTPSTGLRRPRRSGPRPYAGGTARAAASGSPTTARTTRTPTTRSATTPRTAPGTPRTWPPGTPNAATDSRREAPCDERAHATH